MQTVTKVPFFNYPALFKAHETDYIEIIRDVLSRGAYILQRDLVEFEEKLAGFLGAAHAYGVADCTNGLAVGLRAVGIGPGDEVIFPSHTFVSTAGAIVQTGATPVPADIGWDGLLDAGSAESAITPQTKAIMVVQLNGRVCDMDAIQGMADRNGLLVVEDAAQALGATFKDRPAGTFGAFGAFSFYPAKTLGCFGDGGAVVTDDPKIARKIRLQRDHGRDGSSEVQGWGANCRLDNVQAAILGFQLDRYEETVERRRTIARRYHEELREINDLTLPPGPDEGGDHYDIYQNYELQARRRDDLRAYLGERNIGTLIQWGGKAVHQFEKLDLKASLPKTETYFQRCLMLPMNSLLSDDEVDTVCANVRAFYGLRG